MPVNNQIPPFYIIKASGEEELFKVEKLERSLRNSGASDAVIEKILGKVKENLPFKTAKDVYKFAYKFLHKAQPGAAGRYNLKRALYELGPTGFPFERFIGQLFSKLGFEIKVDQYVDGFCVKHELDLIVEKADKRYMVECKFHNTEGIKTNVKIPLYIKARFDDVKKYWEKLDGKEAKFNQAWIATNTKFTWDAIQYSECVGLELIGWSYPAKNNLAQLIDKFALYPITVLPFLSRSQRIFLIQNGVVLCSQLCKNEELLKRMHLGSEKIKKLLDEASLICESK